MALQQRGHQMWWPTTSINDAVKLQFSQLGEFWPSQRPRILLIETKMDLLSRENLTGLDRDLSDCISNQYQFSTCGPHVCWSEKLTNEGQSNESNRFIDPCNLLVQFPRRRATMSLSCTISKSKSQSRLLIESNSGDIAILCYRW